MRLDSHIADALAHGRWATPFDVLGLHPLSAPIDRKSGAWIVRAAHPSVVRAWVLLDGSRLEMERVHPTGLFELVIEERDGFAYRLEFESRDGHRFEVDDPYRFGPVLENDALQRFHGGEESRAWELLGGRVLEHEGIVGVLFSVWAPNADAVSVVGSFNHWDARVHPMRTRGASGIWELFLPGVNPGDLYKFSIATKDGGRTERSDPYGRAMELRPRTASVVVGASEHRWSDDRWLEGRVARHRRDEPLSIYEVHLGSWRRNPDHHSGDWDWLSYRELAESLIPYVARMGFTHVELLPITEHPFDGSWGYQTLGYFAPTSRFGTPDDFRYFVETAHDHGIGVILDWVPAHFPTDGHGLARFDGTALYEHEDPRRGAHPDWGTLVFNYGRREVASFLLSSAVYWIEEFHVDGLRVDAVASMLYLDYSRAEGEWIPNQFGGRENFEAVEFLRRMNDVIHQRHPGVLTFAEESTAWPGVTQPAAEGGLGFDLKWNMGWMNDTLGYLQKDPLFRRHEHDRMTFSLVYAFSEHFLLPLSHDEVVHGKGSLVGKFPGYDSDRMATLRALYAYMWSHPGKKLLFMGGELGQWKEWDHESSLEWHLLDIASHAGIQRLVADLNALHRELPSLHQRDDSADGFEWIDCGDADRSTLVFLRWNAQWSEATLVLANFTPMCWQSYRVGVPFGGRWDLRLNAAGPEYGGTHARPLGAWEAIEGECGGRPFHLHLDVPPFGVLLFTARRKPE